MEKRKKLALAPTGAALAFLCFDFFFRIVKGVQPLETGCGTQHPLRALGGTRVLLAAAPTTPPCFRRWRWSSSLLAMFSGNNIYIFAFGATAFAERSAAMKAPVGLLSGRAVCVSRWRGFAPTSSAERSKRYFHGRGRNGKRQLLRLLPRGELSHSD